MTKAKAGGEQPVEIPDTLPILPLRNSVLFPGAIIPIDVGRRKSVRLVEDAIAKERPVIGILTQKDARTEDPGSGDLYMVGHPGLHGDNTDTHYVDPAPFLVRSHLAPA